MSWRKGRITVHAPFQSEAPGAVDTTTCQIKSLAPKCSRIENSGESQSASKDQPYVDWLSNKCFTHLQAKAVLESNEVHTLCQPIYNTEESFVKELDKYLIYTDMLNLRKKELLYKKWNECVYQPLQCRLRSILNQSFERGQASILQYLDYCKTKDSVILENYNSDDFNPFDFQLCKPHTYKIRTSILNDPLLLQSRSKSEEDTVILQCQKDKVYSLKQSKEFFQLQLPLLPLGHHNIDPIAWLRVPLSSIESDLRQRSSFKITKKGKRPKAKVWTSCMVNI
ncbi:protein FAM228A [Narcine bancroftii]|uniref:protein FAM228A n=1 Tax=Narcine bancroftii TaxID=1343680 RepID=UPI0038322E73